jgi:tRNA threonylcarbamoyladenosine biosynthesis protein TsaB
VRVLGIDTSASSTGKASVALLESGKLVASLEHAQPKQSAERLLPLIAELLALAGWSRGSLERLGVAVGPGSFTGLRIGIACAQGLALGLGVPIVGVTSLRAMARAVPDDVVGVRCAVLDARRGEVFVAAHRSGPAAHEVLAARALPVESARATIEAELGEPPLWIGTGLVLLGLTASHESATSNEPHASAVGLLAEELEPAEHPPLPVYIRDAGATLPNLGAPTPH